LIKKAKNDKLISNYANYNDEVKKNTKKETERGI